MKITKRQLQRIIAEEHELIYGTRGPSSRKTSINKRRSQLMDEAWARNETELLREFGFLKMLKGALGAGGDALGALGAKAAQSAGEFISKQAQAAKGAAEEAAKSIANYADQGWSEWAQGYAKKMEDEFTNDILDNYDKLLKIIGKDGRKKNEEGKWEKLTPEAATAMAMDVLSAAMEAAKQRVYVGAGKVDAKSKLEVLDGGKAEEGDKQAAGYVPTGTVLEGHFRKHKRARKLREARERTKATNKRKTTRRRRR